ncbi:MAG TPA: AcvB/VirJ family lysyl-phosphatidylglycerol hydrolase, partial [Thermoanaerobaculia bacterium]|nr:AcvB/VirJ family lysyl-phosphatidylglycerol hydrolase [Thermoanaerobaculia bacterium]
PLLAALAATIALAASAAGRPANATDTATAADTADTAAAPARHARRAAPAAAPAPAGETLTYGRFGKVALYRQTPYPHHVVLFFSGDGGWNLGVVDMAETLAKMDALVVGINLPHYLAALAASKETCSYPASDAELLSKFVQKKLGFPTYTPPVLVGYSSGATLVYALLVEAPPNTFKGAVSMGFCPDLPLRKPFCAGHGLTWGPGPKGKGVSFKPATTLEQPWVAFQGLIDQVCSPQDVEAYVRQVKHGEAVMLPRVGHGFSVPANWEEQFKQAFQRLTSAVEPGHAPAPAAAAAAAGVGAPAVAPLPPVGDLPLVEVPAKQPAGDLLAVIVSGDGGWAGIDHDVANVLAGKGVPVVGLNSLQYFWNARTPDGAAADLQRIARHYLGAWGKQQLLLVGYSLGADVLPFMASRLPPDLLGRVRLIVLLGPSRMTSFEFHLTDWLGGSGGGDRPVLPEVAKLRGRPLLCLYGQEEKDSLCTEIGGLGNAVALQGSHHFGGDYVALADRILREAQPAAARK